MTATTQIAAFEVGQTYTGRFVTDYDAVFNRTVTKRTAKSIWLTDGRQTKQFRVKASWDGKAEECLPFGNYSMSPSLRADKRAA